MDGEILSDISCTTGYTRDVAHISVFVTINLAVRCPSHQVYPLNLGLMPHQTARLLRNNNQINISGLHLDYQDRTKSICKSFLI